MMKNFQEEIFRDRKSFKNPVTKSCKKSYCILQLNSFQSGAKLPAGSRLPETER